MRVTREKLAQAGQLVREHGWGAWLVLVRETAGGTDPCLPLILEGGLTWVSALLVDSLGRTAAVVGNFDADPLVASQDWDEVVAYVEDFRPAFLKTLENHVPPGAKIAVNTSVSDDKADGLTHGLWTLLESLLAGTRFDGSLTSAEDLAMDLRGQKTPTEVRRIEAAIAEGDRLFAEIAALARPGVTERAVYDTVQRLMAERGLGHAWDPAGDPIVNTGPDSMQGHGLPSPTLAIEPGHVFHVDLGVEKDGYCSDVQRSWFVGRGVPDDVQRAFDAVVGAIDAGAATLRPGVAGSEVDQAARRSLQASGYPEFLHALGHQVGRKAHDGGAILGPLWPRYGRLPTVPVKEHEVFTLELGVTVEGRGYLGIEEMVVVTSSGCRFLTERQTEVMTLE